MQVLLGVLCGQWPQEKSPPPGTVTDILGVRGGGRCRFVTHLVRHDGPHKWYEVPARPVTPAVLCRKWHGTSGTGPPVYSCRTVQEALVVPARPFTPAVLCRRGSGAAWSWKRPRAGTAASSRGADTSTVLRYTECWPQLPEFNHCKCPFYFMLIRFVYTYTILLS